MKTQNRLIALLGLLVSVFAICVWLLRLSHHTETEERIREEREERSDLLDRMLELTGDSLASFAADYSNWSEMQEFVRHPTPAWAAVNIDAGMANFRTDGAWVLSPDGRQIYGTVRGLPEELRTLPLPVSELRAECERKRFLHFFAATPHGLLEFRVAPIQPSEDLQRTSEPQGWFIVARAWDEAHRKEFSRIIHAEISLTPPGATIQPLSPEEIELTRPLRDWRGRTVKVLRTRNVVHGIETIELQNDYEMLLLFGFGLTMIIASTIAISRWVSTPLRRIERSLSEGAGEELRDMETQPDVFGRLAKLVRASFEHRAILEGEIEERRRTEAALSQSREELRLSSEMKTRLARDLHDGVIQSIYAAGLGLESAKTSLATDPAATHAKLEAAQSALNQTIREVRAFIQGIEPEPSATQGFARELATLIATLRSLHAANIQTQITPEAPPLTPREEVHALQIVRECVSNAIRHGEAHSVTISYSLETDRPTLRIHDDGKGFDPARARRGSGLANITDRTTEIDAVLTLSTSPGKGTDIIIRFAHRQLTP